MGGIAAYLAIGVTWAFGYKLLLEMIPGAIHFQTLLDAEAATGEPGRLIYFGLETLTTVSYGDAYPVYRLARSLTTEETLIGQLPRPIGRAFCGTAGVQRERLKARAQ